MQRSRVDKAEGRHTDYLYWFTHLSQSQPIRSKEDTIISQSWHVFQGLDDDCRHVKNSLRQS